MAYVKNLRDFHRVQSKSMSLHIKRQEQPPKYSSAKYCPEQQEQRTEHSMMWPEGLQQLHSGRRGEDGTWGRGQSFESVS